MIWRFIDHSFRDLSQRAHDAFAQFRRQVEGVHFESPCGGGHNFAFDVSDARVITRLES